MPDDSDLDSRYFIDRLIYNCPFCNRRHVSYTLVGHFAFDWTDRKPSYAYFARCGSCGKSSMHLSFKNLAITHIGNYGGANHWRFQAPKDDVEPDLDAAFFYSVPTSFFAIDTRVPKVLRELLTEAEGCLKSNFLTGASACARKLVYELAVLQGAVGDNYDDRIKSLKDLHPEVEPAFFDTLLTIQQMTSSKVHENAADGWEARHLRIILIALSDVLHELYVLPALRADRRKAILDLKTELSPPKGADGA